jgi:hypothetical protein
MPSWLRYLEACGVFATTVVRYDCGPGTKQQRRLQRIDFIAARPNHTVAEHSFTFWIPYRKPVVSFDDKFIRNADVVA